MLEPLGLPPMLTYYALRRFRHTLSQEMPLWCLLGERSLGLCLLLSPLSLPTGGTLPPLRFGGARAIFNLSLALRLSSRC